MKKFNLLIYLPINWHWFIFVSAESCIRLIDFPGTKDKKIHQSNSRLNSIEHIDGQVGNSIFFFFHFIFCWISMQLRPLKLTSSNQHVCVLIQYWKNCVCVCSCSCSCMCGWNETSIWCAKKSFSVRSRRKLIFFFQLHKIALCSYVTHSGCLLKNSSSSSGGSST